MMNFKIYNHEQVNIIILPHSKGGVKTNYIDVEKENREYCERLKENNIGEKLKSNVVIIDGVHSGTGINALQSALQHCYRDKIKNITKIAINAVEGVSKIYVEKEYIFRCEPKFSDTFPRLVTPYSPKDFHNNTKFIATFINLDNPIAEMIINIASNFPEIPVKDSDWYKLNNEITEKVKAEREEEKRRVEEHKIRNKKTRCIDTTGRRMFQNSFGMKQNSFRMKQIEKNTKETFIVNILPNEHTKGIVYQCPKCNSKSGSSLIIPHKYNCPNNGKTPITEPETI